MPVTVQIEGQDTLVYKQDEVAGMVSAEDAEKTANSRAAEARREASEKQKAAEQKAASAESRASVAEAKAAEATKAAEEKASEAQGHLAALELERGKAGQTAAQAAELEKKIAAAEKRAQELEEKAAKAEALERELAGVSAFVDAGLTAKQARNLLAMPFCKDVDFNDAEKAGAAVTEAKALFGALFAKPAPGAPDVDAGRATGTPSADAGVMDAIRARIGMK